MRLLLSVYQRPSLLRFIVNDQTRLNVSRCCVAENKMFIGKVQSNNTITRTRVMLLNTILSAGKSHVLNSVS
jgi:hypothetical protein